MGTFAEQKMGAFAEQKMGAFVLLLQKMGEDFGAEQKLLPIFAAKNICTLDSICSRSLNESLTNNLVKLMIFLYKRALGFH